MTYKEKSFRATFEDVLVSQEKLRKWLDRLVEENRPLKPEERGPFIQLVGRSMLGQGTKIPIRSDWIGMTRVNESLHWTSGELSGDISLESAEDMIRFLAYWDVNKVGNEKETQPISEAWKEVRQLALKTFPLALAQAASMSIEHIPYEPTKSERF